MTKQRCLEKCGAHNKNSVTTNHYKETRWPLLNFTTVLNPFCSNGKLYIKCQLKWEHKSPVLCPPKNCCSLLLKLIIHLTGHVNWLIGKDTVAGKDWRQEEKGTTEDEMAGWHHWLNGHESEWTPGVGDGQGGLAWCNSWGRKELDMTEQLNRTELNPLQYSCLENAMDRGAWRATGHGISKN